MKKGIHGFYKIQNTENQKLYVGSSKDLRQRWYKHKSLLKNGKHENQKLQNAVLKYGLDKFKFEILEIVEDLNEFSKIRNVKEQEWKDFLNAEYNLQDKVDYSELTDETKEKISKTLKQRHKEGTVKKTNTKKLFQYCRFTGKLIKVWDCVNDAIRSYGLTDFTTSKIHRCCWGEAPSFAGFVWSYDELNFYYARAPKCKNTVVLIDEINKEYSFFSSTDEIEKLMKFGKGSLRSCKNNLYRKQYRYYFISAQIIKDLKPFELLGTRKVIVPTTQGENLNVNGVKTEKRQ